MALFLAEAKKQGRTISEDNLRDLIQTFLMAGRTATASALSWTLFCLCKHPDVQEKVRLKILKVCGNKGPMYEDMSQLWYLQAVINEAMRLYPSIPVGCKVAVDDDVLPSGTTVAAGTVLWYNLYAMGRDPEIWGVDAKTFRPERWLEMEAPPDNYRYPVFHAGPRECLGKSLALVEIKACFAMLLPQLSFKLAVHEEQIKMDAQLCIGMGHGLPCVVTADNRHRSESSDTTAGSEGRSLCGTFSDTWNADVPARDANDPQENLCSTSVEKCEEKVYTQHRHRRSGRARQREKKRMRQAAAVDVSPL